MQKKAPL